ncbi:hypothetical protein Mal33_46090 [Rosistilla oblonga]|uniref:Uncharacterized protein n=1 Tax=Rosistilla oblonga TaxID=2527990 RepID=A0A518IZR4_9BACT|nr:hypothetical protein Mal33_46090 [Rosistilla oblonga]
MAFAWFVLFAGGGRLMYIAAASLGLLIGLGEVVPWLMPWATCCRSCRNWCARKIGAELGSLVGLYSAACEWMARSEWARLFCDGSRIATVQCVVDRVCLVIVFGAWCLLRIEGQCGFEKFSDCTAVRESPGTKLGGSQAGEQSIQL